MILSRFSSSSMLMGRRNRLVRPAPQAVIDKVGFAVDKIGAAGKIAGTLVPTNCHAGAKKACNCSRFIPTPSCALG